MQDAELHERKDLRYDDDIVSLRFQAHPETEKILFPHIQLKTKLTPSVYRRVLIAAECAVELLSSYGVEVLIANVPEESKGFVQALGFMQYNEKFMVRNI